MSPPANTADWPSWLMDLGSGVYAIDTGFQRPRCCAAYLRVYQGRAAFIDTGPNPSLPRLLGALEVLGIDRQAVDWVIPTHVHLDHAGASGVLMQALPAATLLVHPRGVRHLVDPSALYDGAKAVYGEAEMARSYGTLLPVDPARIQASHDGQTVSLGGLPLRLIDTPGHARHHHCLWDEATRGWFTGDTFGLSYREFDNERGPWVLPTSSPAQFDPQALRHSVQRLLAVNPDCMYVTHFGRVGDVPRLGALMLELIDRMASIGRALQQADDRHRRLKDSLVELSLDSLQAHGCRLSRAAALEVLDNDLELNAQGLALWVDRLDRDAAAR
jgi:glyoxylase-like metal-dependent hydrolase (beta-lactamase superfamily II)